MALSLDRLKTTAAALVVICIAASGCAGLETTSTPADPGLRDVRFSYVGPAQSVCVAGDFNGWSPNKNCLKNDPDGNGGGSSWTATLKIKPGRYGYAFLLDGGEFVPDPKAVLLEEDGFGGVNSVLFVKE